MRPVTIAAAITGSILRKKDNPALPAEQIELTHAPRRQAGSSSSHPCAQRQRVFFLGSRSVCRGAGGRTQALF